MTEPEIIGVAGRVLAEIDQRIKDDDGYHEPKLASEHDGAETMFEELSREIRAIVEAYRQLARSANRQENYEAVNYYTIKMEAIEDVATHLGLRLAKRDGDE